MTGIAVIGAGISGIAASHYARSRGWNVDLYEAETQIGGRIGCTTLMGREVEFGGKNIGRRYRRFRQFTDFVGDVRYEEFGLNSSREIDGRLACFNKDGSALNTLRQLRRLCGIRGIIQLLPHALAILNDREQGFLNTPHFNACGRRGDDVPLSGHFSPRCVQHLIRTLTVRMNAAEPEECHLGNLGSNLGLLLDRFEQINGGMNGLLAKYREKSANVRWLTGRPVLSVSSQKQGGALVVSQGETGLWHRSYDHVVVSLPAAQAKSLFVESAPKVAELLAKVKYFPVGVAIARYPENVFSSKRRAMAFDRNSPLSNAGAYGIDDLDLVRYTFSGHKARRDIDADTAGDSVLSLGERRLAHHFPVAKKGCLDFAYRYMPFGLCAYSAHHGELLTRIRRAAPQSVALTGDYWRGASIEACFRSSEEVVAQLSRH